MIRLELFTGLLVLALCLYCLIDVIGRSADEVRNLPKFGWIVLVLFFPLVGSIAYLVAGRPQQAVARRSPYERSAPEFPEYDRPGRASAADPEADAAFLRQVRARAEEQRRRYREQQGQAPREAQGEGQGEGQGDSDAAPGEPTG